MNKEFFDLLRSCSKDEPSFKTLSKAFEKLFQENEKNKTCLSLLESAIRNDYDAIMITELEMEEPGPRIVYVNEGFTTMTGYSRDDIIGKTPRILQGPKTDRSVLDKLKSNLKAGKSFFGQTVNYRKDGSEFVNQWDIHPLINTEGKITHWVSYQHDITERKRAEDALYEADTEIDDTFESTQRTIVDFDRDGNILFANKAFRDLVTFDKEELLKMKIWDLMPNKQHQAFRSRISEIWDDKGAQTEAFNVMIRKKNGVPIQVEIVMKPLTMNGGRVMRADVRNISLRKKVLAALEKRNTEFGEIFTRSNDFRYGMELDRNKPVFMWLSQSFEDITGYTEQEVSGMDNWKRIIHKDDLPLVLNHYKKAEEKHSSCEAYRIVTKSGNILNVMDYAKKDRGDENRIRGTVTEMSITPA